MKVRSGPDGIHIFDRRTGTNALINEVIPPRESWTISPRQVSIALTNACNLKCSHCYAPKTAAVLGKEQVTQWMKQLDTAGTFGIGFGGGEPTLHPDLAEICKFGQRNTNLAMSMTTHGHRLTAELVDKLANNLNFIRISMDGVEDTYEQIRGVSRIQR